MSALIGMSGRVRGRLAAAAAFVVCLVVTADPARADYPIAGHRYIADPTGIEYNGRLYLYGSNDDDNTGEAYTMRSIVCVSTDDLKNWTDHGVVFQVPRDTSWASFSWAPSVVFRNSRFYLYFGDNAGSGIGVASSSSPTGPFVDARGSRLISTSTPGASGTNQWYFDPAVFVDDDGQAYLYFGGNGLSNGRWVRLNADMISLATSSVSSMGTIPNFFEGSYLHKRDGTYYFSYSAVPAVGQSIHYGTSTSGPTSGFTWRGEVLWAPTNFNNNHQSFFSYLGQWYAAYHNRYVSDGAGYKRNLCLDRLIYNGDGTLQAVVPTLDGLSQLKAVNPYLRVEAETFADQEGIETEPSSEGGMNVGFVENGDWVRVRGVDFGSTGATRFDARVASATAGGTIELRLDGVSGTVIGTCSVPGTGGWQTWTTVSCAVTPASARGVHDLYLRFAGGSGLLLNVNWWQFASGATPTPTTRPTATATPTATTRPTPTPTTPGGGTVYQAESAVLGGGVVTESTHGGYSGSGYVNFPASGGTLDFGSVSGGGGGSTTLSFRFALASGSRTGQLTVNGSSQNVTFASTGAWTTWQVQNVSVALNAGTGNTVRLQSTGQDLANVDQLTVTTSPSRPTPTPTARVTATPTATARPTATPTARVTPTPTARPTATPTSGAGATCANPTTVSMPITIDGTGDFCRFTTGTIANVNSWNTQLVEINGGSYTNGWSDTLPARINGGYYIRYVATVGWAHFEAR